MWVELHDMLPMLQLMMVAIQRLVETMEGGYDILGREG